MNCVLAHGFLGDCEQWLPFWTVGNLSVNCRPAGYRHITSMQVKSQMKGQNYENSMSEATIVLRYISGPKVMVFFRVSFSGAKHTLKLLNP